MGQLIVQLVPTVLGIALSPLAIMALIAVLLSPRTKVNGIAYLIGWAIGVVLVMLVGLWVFSSLQVHEHREPPAWVAVVRVLIGLVLVFAAVWVYRRGRAHVRQMAEATTPAEVVEAAPQLPGWLQKVSTFRPGRCLALGTGLFVLNPVDASCALIAALDITMARLDGGATVAVVIGVCIVAVAPIAIPVGYVIARGPAAQPFLDGMRTWVASHTTDLNAALLLVIGVLQLDKGLTALL